MNEEHFVFNHIIFLATVRKSNAMQREQLTEFGKYMSENLPKYIEKIQLTAGDELELLIAPDGVVPVLHFLKGHHAAQFTSLVDITAIDVPSREYRFEVSNSHFRI